MQKNGCGPRAAAIFVYLPLKNKQYKLPGRCRIYAHKLLGKATLQARTLANKAGKTNH